MKTTHHPLISLLAAVIIFPLSLHAQTKKETNPGAVEGFTADEAFDKARRAFNEKNYEQAAAIYSQFRKDFGKSEEAKNALRNSAYELAICFTTLQRFSEAIDAIQEALAISPPLPRDQRQDLQFWLGVSYLQIKDHARARDALQKFIADSDPKQKMATTRAHDANILIGTAWIAEGRFREAANHFQNVASSLPAEYQSRIKVLQLHALTEAGDYKNAMDFLRKESVRLNEITQLISFQMLTLKLGNVFLEQGEYRNAISCLQLVWPFQKLLTHQEDRLAGLNIKLSEVSGDSFHSLQLKKQIRDVGDELEKFRKTEGFDSSLRFRLANAYLQMKRYREAALIMEKMVADLPKDKTTEQASLNVIRCWNALEAWPKSASAAQVFIQSFPSSPLVPEALLLQAEAYQASLEYEKAASAFESLAKRFPSAEATPRARFMQAFTLLQSEKNQESAEILTDFLSKYPKHHLADDAAYWIGMSWSFDKQFEKCRTAMDDYLKSNPKGRYRGAATYRKAYCAQQMDKYGTAIDELHEYLERFPGEPENNEARVLLGNALMNEGFMDDAFSVFRAIPSTDKKLYEEAVFRTAEGLKAMEQYDKFRALMQEFIAKNPQSPRIAEAIGHLGWYFRQKDQPEKALEIYWKAILDHGNNPEIVSVDDLISSLSRMYKGPEKSNAYLAKLRDLTADAQKRDQKTLATRLLHAQGQALKKSEPAKARALFLEANKLAVVQSTNSALLLDFATALAETGKDKESAELLRETLRWNPKALQKDRILAALGQHELKKGNEKAALDYFARFEKETLGSVIFGQTMLAQAQILDKRNNDKEAHRVLEAVLTNPTSSGQEKAEALCMIGEIYMSAGKPNLAIPYFQRVYVMHKRWKPWVAKAYLRSGEAFEKLQDAASARRTYQELTSDSEFSEFSETARAKQRLEALNVSGTSSEDSKKG